MHVSRHRRFQVIENPGLQSKAENVLYALNSVTASPGAVVAVFDADHHPVSRNTVLVHAPLASVQLALQPGAFCIC